MTGQVWRTKGLINTDSTLKKDKEKKTRYGEQETTRDNGLISPSRPYRPLREPRR